MAGIDVANGQELGLGVDPLKVSLPHSAHANDSLCEGLTGRGKAFPAQNIAGNNVDGGKSGNRSF